MSSTSIRRPRLTSLPSILTAALALVEQGWTKGRDHRVVNDRHEFCARGAILHVSRTPDQARAAVELLQSAGRIVGIVSYNDRPTTTKAQIVRKFQTAIARAKRA